MDLVHAGVVEAEALQTTHLEVFCQDIGPSHQSQDHLTIILVAEVGDYRTFAAVAAVKIGGIAAAAIGALDERRSPLAGVIPSRRFDLDHVGAEVGQHLADPGSGKYPR